jgi:xylulokinase
MRRELILSIDIGTTGMKFGLYDARGRNLIFLRKATPLLKRDLGTIDVKAIYDAVVSGICEVVKESGSGDSIAVIGVDGQMGGILGIDEKWEPVIHFDPPINNNYREHMKKALSSFGSSILEETGSIPINGSKILYWMKEQPEKCRRVKKFLSLGAYITGKLTGLEIEKAFIDRTTTYLFGLAKGSGWSESLCHQLQIPQSILPTVVESTKIVGKLQRDVSRVCDMRDGIPCIAGVGDTSSSILGAGVTEEGEAIDIAGTCSVFGICSSKGLIDRKNKALLRMQAPLPDIYYLVGIGFGGEVYSWFLHNVYAHNTPPGPHDELIRSAESIQPGSEGLFFFPFLGGIFTPPNDTVRGTWFGFDWKHTIAHMYRSILESFGYEYFHYFDIYKEISKNLGCGSVVVTGSGRKNHLWNQIKADILGADYLLLNRDDQENLGTALVAATSVNLIDDLRVAVSSCSKIHKRIPSIPANTEKYSPLSKRYMRYKTEVLNSIYPDITISGKERVSESR